MPTMLNKKRSLVLKQGRGGAAIKGAKEGFTAEAQRARPSTKLRMRGYEEFRSW